MGEQDKPPFRADHVGSLLRPASLLALRERVRTGQADAAALAAHEDDCVAAVAARQTAIGLKATTDGEFRRESFHGDFINSLHGVDFGPLSKAERAGAPGGPFVALVTQRVSRPSGGIDVESFRFLRSVTDGVAKHTMPSPTMLHFRGGRAAISSEVYPDLDVFFGDAAGVWRAEIAALGDAGCRYLQLDDTNLAYLCDPEIRAKAAARGEDVETLPQRYCELINEAVRDRPSDMAVCVHLCRGNARSRWFATGGYDPVAEVVFESLDVDGFFLEYDDERSGDFSPLRHVPPGKRVVLGLLTSKSGRLEEVDQLKRRIDEASRFIDPDQLCLSPQCGFASAADGNRISEDQQWRKLERVVEVARTVW